LVRSSQNEDLGSIEEFMIEPDTGRIAYAVLSLAGFLRVDGKLHAVPWAALELDPANRVFVLHADRETLSNAPTFHEEEWPDFTDPAWGWQIHNHYGRRHEWDRASECQA
jgi:hypothetical protein